MEFSFKSKRIDAILAVKREGKDGAIDQKDLVFDCSPSNYQFLKNAVDAGKAIEKTLANGLKVDDIETIMESERMAFETMAPGRWDEFFEFLEQDVATMAYLVKAMLETIRRKGAEAKAAEITPKVPDGEQV